MDKPSPIERGTAVLQARGLSKNFGPIRALSGVDLDIRAGRIVALLGENGAGKSTLLKILSGDHEPSSGSIELNGQSVTFRSPKAARDSGIRVIYQEPEIFEHLSVAENIYVGSLPKTGRIVNKSRLLRESTALLEELGFDGLLSPTALGDQLSPAQRQLVEIARAMTAPVSVMAFDEPTSSLSGREVTALFSLIRSLASRGVAIVYVSHRMNEIFELADDVTVLRDGKSVGSLSIAATNERELIQLMVGRDVENFFGSHTRTIGGIVLQTHKLSTHDVQDINLTVRAGEVVSIAGLIGAGRSELARAIFGDVPILSGSVSMLGQELRMKSPQDAIRSGIGFAPEERKAEALLLKRSILENVSLAMLSSLTRMRFINQSAERSLVKDYVARLRVRATGIDQEVSTLSGGNQQKVVVARWLARKPALLILDEPTRGVDVGAKADIYRIIGDLAETGVAVLVISSELPEAIGLADRVIVMRSGTISGELPRASATEEAILALALPPTPTTALDQ